MICSICVVGLEVSCGMLLILSLMWWLDMRCRMLMCLCSTVVRFFVLRLLGCSLNMMVCSFFMVVRVSLLMRAILVVVVFVLCSSSVLVDLVVSVMLNSCCVTLLWSS